MSDIQMPIYAFPIHPDVDIFLDKTWCGMTLRDYFAAKALQGMLAEISLKATVEEFANKSYELADAMMKAREE
jgi:hypothetical protein